jgi:hypothetical protein
MAIQIRGVQIQDESIASGKINLSGSFDFRAASSFIATTQAEATKDTKVATTQFVHTVVSSSVADVNLTAGDGIAIDTSTNPDTVSVDLATNPGLQFTSNKLDVKVKSETGGTITKDANGLYIADSAIGNAKLAGSIANGKLANSTISGVSLGGNLNSLSKATNGGVQFSSYNGSAAVSNLSLDINDLAAAAVNVGADSIAIYDADADVSGKETIADLMTAVAGAGLGASSGVLSVGVDDSSVEINSDALRVKASGITNAMLAGSIANAKLANSTISGVALGSNLNALTPATNGGVLFSSYNGSAAVSNLQLDISDLAGAAVNVGADSIAIYDADADATGKELISDLATAQAGNGIAASSGVFAVDLDGSTLAVGASGVKISDGGVGATQLASSAVSAAKIASNAVETAKVADNAITAPKLGFEARQDVFAPNGSTSAFDLAVEVPSEFFNFTLAYKNGLLQKKVASSPGDADEYTVSTAGGTTTITFGANLSSSDVLIVHSLG